MTETQRKEGTQNVGAFLKPKVQDTTIQDTDLELAIPMSKVTKKLSNSKMEKVVVSTVALGRTQRANKITTEEVTLEIEMTKTIVDLVIEKRNCLLTKNI